MKKFIKIFVIIFTVLILVASVTYIDYFVSKTKNTYPKIALLKQLNDDLFVYNSIFYRVWYCKTNNTYTIGNYNDKDAVCPKNYQYENGYYTNSLGIKISKRDLQLLTNNDTYTHEMVDNMSSDSQVENAVHVAYNYGKINYKEIEDENLSSSLEYKLIIFPEFVEDDKDNYNWEYDESEENYYCLDDSQELAKVAKYENNECGVFEEIKMDEKWCTNYKNSTLGYDTSILKYCEE